MRLAPPQQTQTFASNESSTIDNNSSATKAQVLQKIAHLKRCSSSNEVKYEESAEDHFNCAHSKISKDDIKIEGETRSQRNCIEEVIDQLEKTMHDAQMQVNLSPELCEQQREKSVIKQMEIFENEAANPFNSLEKMVNLNVSIKTLLLSTKKQISRMSRTKSKLTNCISEKPKTSQTRRRSTYRTNLTNLGSSQLNQRSNKSDLCIMSNKKRQDNYDIIHPGPSIQVNIRQQPLAPVHMVKSHANVPILHLNELSQDSYNSNY
jgi:hypothetical protein